ncbi:hypothetical protein M5K25_010273 [Dendrobium thyrsiflorum]|uniref:Uncharacterized protein n=1 Tax=Dendrobium thyrsiflorum TaxID=117978 RepID=A0ABD0UZ81_DENTH
MEEMEWNAFEEEEKEIMTPNTEQGKKRKRTRRLYERIDLSTDLKKRQRSLYLHQPDSAIETS